MEEKRKVEEVNPGGGGAEPPEGGGGTKVLLITVIASVVLAFGAVYLILMPNLVSKTNYTTDTENIVRDISELQTSITDLTAQVSTLSNSVNSANSEVASVRGSIAGYATQGSLSTLQTSLATIQADLNTVKTNVGDIPALNAKVVALQTSLDSLEAQVTALDARVVKLETKTTTTSSSGGTTTQLASDTLDGVTVMVEPFSYLPVNPIYGNSSIPAMPIIIDGTNDGTLTFQLTIQNDTASTIKNLILQLSFVVADTTTGGIKKFNSTDVTLSCPGILWTNASPNANADYVIFSGGSVGVFSFRQDVGDREYVCTLTIPNGHLIPANTYYLYPQIKIVSFNN